MGRYTLYSGITDLLLSIQVNVHARRGALRAKLVVQRARPREQPLGVSRAQQHAQLAPQRLHQRAVGFARAPLRHAAQLIHGLDALAAREEMCEAAIVVAAHALRRILERTAAAPMRPWPAVIAIILQVELDHLERPTLRLRRRSEPILNGAPLDLRQLERGGLPEVGLARRAEEHQRVPVYCRLRYRKR